MKYLTVTNWFDKNALPKIKHKTGFYQWLQVFDGDIEVFSRVEDFEKYDVVHINMTGGDANLIPEVRKIIGNSSSTKIVACTDYAIELWQQRYGHPFLLRHMTDSADVVIATEYCLASALAALLERKVYRIPHPADLDYLRKIEKAPKKVAGVMYHRYDDQIYSPYIALKGMGYTPALLGYIRKESKHWGVISSLFPNIIEYCEYEDIVKHMAKCSFLYEPTTIHTYGRVSVEAAAMGIPCIGSMFSEAQRNLFPKLTSDPYNFTKIRAAIDLLADEKVKSEILEVAEKGVGFYSRDVCRESFKKTLEEVK